jgi:hypothetical protein
MAQWHLYGHGGVATKSSLDRVRSSVQSAGNVERSSCGQVSYLTVSGDGARYFSGAPSQPLPPYYFKEIAYKHESEVRFVFAINPDNYDASAGGVTLELDPSVLVEEIIISPHMFRDEAKALQAYIVRRLTTLPKTKIRRSSLLFSFSRTCVTSSRS